MSRRIIGITGPARVGKDTVGNHLVSNYDFEQLAFASKIKEAARLLELPVNVGGMTLSFGEVEDTWGDDAKNPAVSDIRSVMVSLGQVMRNLLGQGVWVQPVIDVIRSSPETSFVITDVRQPDEAQALRYFFGAEIWAVTRPGYGPADDTEASTLVQFEPDITLSNDGSFDHLYTQIEDVYGSYRI